MEKLALVLISCATAAVMQLERVRRLEEGHHDVAAMIPWIYMCLLEL
jgi:hypothetical protein